MPLERRTREPPRTYQRTCRAIPRQSMCTPLDLQVSEGLSRRSRIINNTPSLLFLSNRRGHITCMCSVHNETFHACTYDAHNQMGNEAEETQRLNENTVMHRSMWTYETTAPHLENGNRVRDREARDEVQNNRLPSNSSISLNFTTATVETPSLHFDETNRISNLNHILDSPDVPSTSGTTHLELETNNCKKSLVQLTNHDRSIDELFLPSPPSDNDQMPATVTYKLCTLSMPVMPPPSANSRHVAARVIKYARNTKIPEENLLSCPDCKILPTLPVTGRCGHTRCTKYVTF